MKSESTRRVPSFWSASCLSSVLFMKSHKTSRFVYIPPLCLATKKIDLIYFSCPFCANCFSYIKFSLFSNGFEVPEPCYSRSSSGCGGVSCRVLCFDFRGRGTTSLNFFFNRFFLFYFNSEIYKFKKKKKKKGQNNIVSAVLMTSPN